MMLNIMITMLAVVTLRAGATSAFQFASVTRSSSSVVTTRASTLLFSTSSTNAIENGISRLETLQTLLNKHGAPGSLGCKEANDLEPVSLAPTAKEEKDETPELISYIMGWELQKHLHPHLYPIARSKSTGNYVCGLRRAYADDATNMYENSSNSPWPIVEAKPNGPGMRLLALNSEHLMRRIAVESDFQDESGQALVTIYNDGLGQGILNDKALDAPYKSGDAEKLGYGVDKYVLLRVGPFADIYEILAKGHASKNDESSALISAEAANNKIAGFSSTFLFYARLLKMFPNRDEEVRDAARMCLRLPLPSIGLVLEDFKDVAILGQIATEDDSIDECMAKLQAMYEKMRQHEQDEDPRTSSSKTKEQTAIDEANHLLDTTALAGSNWSEIRPKLADIYKSAGRDDMASFVYQE